jgi:hypothetical protein
MSGIAPGNTYKLVVRTGGPPAARCTSGTTLLSGAGQSFLHTGLVSGTTYHYRVCAIDRAGNVSTGPARTATPE